MNGVEVKAAEQRWYRTLIRALVFFFVIHLVALPLMGLVIQPGFDLAISTSDRAAYVADNWLLWRLAWLPWQLSALSDLIVSVALVAWLRARHERRALRWAVFGAACNVVAAIPEQFYELRLVTAHLGLAQDALTNNQAGLDGFEDEQRMALIVTSVWSASWYLVMTLAWHRALTIAAGGYRWLSGVFGKLLGILVVGLAGAAVLLSLQIWGGLEAGLPITVAAGVGFVTLCIWSLAAADMAGRAHHRAGSDSQLHQIRWPNSGQLRWLAGVANSRGLRDCGRLMPFVTLKSDIDDVVYLNWLVPTADAQQVLPAPLACEDLDGLTVVSILTYRHGGFGPALYGPLRRLLPSPLQSNWRLYLQPIPAGGPPDAIYFFKTALSMWPHVAVSRLIADGLPAHYPLEFSHHREGRTITSVVDPGAGSAPGLKATVVEIADRQLPAKWADRFESWEQAVAYLVDQNRGLQVDGTTGDVWESTIDIPIPINTITQATVEQLEMAGIPAGLMTGRGDSSLFAFVVPKVPFRATGERTISTR